LSKNDKSKKDGRLSNSFDYALTRSALPFAI